MSVYMTEEEQIESIKKWWKKHGNLITVLISIVLFTIAGYRYLNWHREKITQQASVAYEQMMVALSNHNYKSVQSYANELINKHQRSIYADVAHMTLAKIYVSKNKLDKGMQELQAVVKDSQIPALKQMSKIRMARILVAEKLYSNALKELESIDDSIYLPVINELKGDIYAATGQYQQAMSSYKLALDEVKTNEMDHLFLEMKANEIANKSQSMISEDKKIQSA